LKEQLKKPTVIVIVRSAAFRRGQRGLLPQASTLKWGYGAPTSREREGTTQVGNDPYDLF
jgi:hypothetical protein